MIYNLDPDAKALWEDRINWESTNAFISTKRKRMYPRTDFINLSFNQARILTEIGSNRQFVKANDAPLPAFTVDIGFDASGHCLECFYPNNNPATDYEFEIYALSLTFSSGETVNACDVTLHFGIHSGGGCENIGTLGFTAHEDDKSLDLFAFHLDLPSYEEFGLYDLDSIVRINEWISYLWNGIQYQFIERPETIHFYHKRQRNFEGNPESSKTRAHVAKLTRIINICLDDEDDSMEINISTNHHEITLSCWSVAGHWRSYQDGRKIWIKPYYKGKDRNKPDCHFNAKEYRLFEEDE